MFMINKYNVVNAILLALLLNNEKHLKKSSNCVGVCECVCVCNREVLKLLLTVNHYQGFFH